MAAGALASAASAVGVVALWTAGLHGVMLIYDLIRIGLGIHETEHTDCASLNRLSDQLYDRLIQAGGDVIADVASVGLGKIVGKLHDVFKRPLPEGLCSFHGDTLVLTRAGQKPIRDIRESTDEVWARDERTGKVGWKTVLAQYGNTYAETVRTTVRDVTGAEQTIVSNRIHPFFARITAGTVLVAASAGHVYAGDIDGGAWIDAQHLEPGHELLSSDGRWQEVIGKKVEVETLEAFNLTVEGYHTYHVAGRTDAVGVLVHNDCYDARPDGFDTRDGVTDYDQEIFRAPNGEQVYRGHDGKFYDLDKHEPTPLSGKPFVLASGQIVSLPNQRHYLERLGPKSRSNHDGNTIILPGVDVDKDLADILSGKAIEIENDIHVNGRVYRRHQPPSPSDRLIPVRGTRFEEITQRQYNILKMLKTPQKSIEENIENARKNPRNSEEDVKIALDLLTEITDRL